MKPSAPSSDSSSSRPAERPPQRPAPKREREAFEQLLEARESRPEAAGGLPPTVFEVPRVEPVEDDAGLAPLERADAHPAAPLRAAVVEPSPSVVAALPDPSQAAWARQLQAPAVAPGEVTRFQVIDPAAPRWLSSVDVQALGPGGVTVAVVTGAEHAALLDRHLPQLQRRLGARGVSHVRVDGRDDAGR